MITPAQRVQMAKWVRELLGPAKAVSWWETPNPLLGGVKPYVMTLMNREESLYEFIKESHEANDMLGLPKDSQ